MTRKMQIGLAFVIGACAGSSGPLVAEPVPDPEPAPNPVHAPAPPPASSAQATATNLSTAVRRASSDGKAQIAVLARGDSAFIGQLELDGLVEIPNHRDKTEEYIVVLEGGGTLLIDGRAHQLTKGSAVFMPANAEVSYANGPNKLVALQVFAGPGPAAKYDRWEQVGD